MSCVWSASGLDWTLTNYHKRSGALPTTETYFSQHWSLEIQQSGCQSGRVLVRALFPEAACWLLICPHMVERESLDVFVVLEEHQFCNEAPPS